MEIIQVSATSPTSAVAQAIASVIHEYRCAELQAIGAEAVHQAMQALTLASGYLQHDGIPVTFVPQYKRVIVENKQRTLVRFVVTPKRTSNMSPTSPSETLIKADLPRV
jgi:stage V sporulation protein S